MLFLEKKDVTFQVCNHLEDDVVKCDRDGLRQVFLNCLLNSIDAIESCNDHRKGIISITISDKFISDGRRYLVIQIEDNGVGIEEKSTFTYFEPFYTTKEPGKGTGLGLAVSHSIVESHHGSIAIDKADTEGAIVTIEIPFTIDHEDEKNESRKTTHN